MKEVEQRVHGEEPVLMIGSPMCRAFSTLIDLTHASKPSEVKHKNLVERCVTHLMFWFRMYETQRNAGRSVGCMVSWPQFVYELAEIDGVYKTEGNFRRFKSATNIFEKRSWFMSNSERIIEKLSMRCCNRDEQAKNHMKNCVIAVLKGLKREIDSAKAIGSMEFCVTGAEPNVPESDEYVEELQYVFAGITGVRVYPELSSALRTVEVDFMNRLEVHRKRPRSWATDKGLHVIPTKWENVNKRVAKRPEFSTRLCGKEFQRWDPTKPGASASMGPLECVMFILSKLMWKPRASCATTRTILFLHASRAHCQAEATSEMVIKLPLEEQVKGEDLIGEL